MKSSSILLLFLAIVGTAEVLHAETREERLATVQLEINRLEAITKGENKRPLTKDEQSTFIQLQLERNREITAREQGVPYVPQSAKQARQQTLLSDSTSVRQSSTRSDIPTQNAVPYKELHNTNKTTSVGTPPVVAPAAKLDSVRTQSPSASEDAVDHSGTLGPSSQAPIPRSQSQTGSGNSERQKSAREADVDSMSAYDQFKNSPEERYRATSRKVTQEQEVERQQEADQVNPQVVQKRKDELAAEEEYRKSYRSQDYGTADAMTMAKDGKDAEALKNEAKYRKDLETAYGPKDTASPGSGSTEKPAAQTAQTPPQKSMREMENDSMKKLGDYENPRCLYSGYAIDGAENGGGDCKPIRDSNSKDVKGEDAANGVKETHCGSSMVMCNPLVFGVDSGGRGVCVKASKDASKDCQKQAKKNSKDPKAKAATDKLMKDAENKKRRDALKKKIERACKNDSKEYSTNVKARKNHQDHEETCKTLKETLNIEDKANGQPAPKVEEQTGGTGTT